jgi:hypothetical protein
MSEITQVELAACFRIQPAELPVVGKRIPLSRQGYIPLMIFNSNHDMVDPVFGLDDGVVTLSLGRPFGFAKSVDNGARIVRSQKTDGMVLAPGTTVAGHWWVTLETPGPLTVVDRILFDHGIASYVGAVLTRRQLQLHRSALDRASAS